MAETQCPNCPSRECSLKGGRVREYFAQPYWCRRCKKSFKAAPVKPVEEIIAGLPPGHARSFGSRSGDGRHKTCNMRGTFLCTCPRFFHTHKDCWHIKRLKREAGVPVPPTFAEVLEANGAFGENGDSCPAVILKRPQRPVCTNPDCGSIDIQKAGHNNDANRTQRYRCKACGMRFQDNLGSENKHATAEQIAFALGEKKMSYKDVIERLEAVHHIRVSRGTVYNRQKCGNARISNALKHVRPRVSGDWTTDEVCHRVKGKKAYTVTIMDSASKYWLASDTVRKQGEGDAVNVFRKAMERAGKKPSRIKSDKADYFASAYERVYAAKNGLQKQCVHERVEHLTHENNNCAHESFNGTKIRPCTNNMRGFQSTDTPQMLTAEVNHNFVMPHEGLGGMTPAEAAGIYVHGDDRWLVLLELAAYWEYHPPTRTL